MFILNYLSAFVLGHLLGIFVSSGMVVSSFVVWKQARVRGFSEEKVIDIFILSFLVMAVFGRAAYVASHPQVFLPDPGRILLFLKFPGFSYPIGILSAGFSVAIVSRLNDFSVWENLDIFSTAAVFGMLVGYVGCALSGCLGGQRGLEIALVALAILQIVLFLGLSKAIVKSARFSVWQKRPGVFFLSYLIFSLLSLLILSYAKGNERVFFAVALIGAIILFLTRYKEILVWLSSLRKYWGRLRSILRTEEKI